MTEAPKRSRAEYMRDYRARKRAGAPTIRQMHHEACDRVIAKQAERIKTLEIENRDLRALLPF